MAAADWERIEADYRAGVKTLREIASEHGVSHPAIAQKAKRSGWERDLQGKIKAKAEALVTKSAVTSEVTKERAGNEKVIVEANAQAVAGVAIRHRTDLKDLRDAAMAMLAELRQVGDHVDTLDEMAKLLADENGDSEAAAKRLDRVRDALNRATGLPGRIASIKALSDTIAKVIEAERTAWKLDKPAEEGAGGVGKTLSDAERASRLATILERARSRPPAPTQADATVH